jgi:CRP-like cAMP-binding protein
MIATPRPYLYQDLKYLGIPEKFVDDVFALIGDDSLYEKFNRQDCELLCQFMHCFAAPKDAELLTEGMEGDYMILILSGQVRVSKQDIFGGSIGLAVVGPGSFLGEMSLIDGEHRFATCIAYGPVRFAVLTRADLNELLFAHPRLANKLLLWLLRVSIGRVRDTDMMLMPGMTGAAV